jgi:Rad3-related DNA helicase
MASGTLMPFQAINQELGGDFECLEASFESNPQNIHIAIGSGVGDVQLKFTRENVGNLLNIVDRNYPDNAMIKALGEMLSVLLATIPNGNKGVIVFFPSFVFLQSVVGFWKAKGSWTLILQGKTVFVDQEGSEWGNQQAIFTVYRGRMSEGYDFRDDLCRMAICKS